MSKAIALTKGRSTIVDDVDYDLLSQWKWQLNGNYAARRQYVPGGKPVLVLMHRLINGTPDGILTDHINGDCLDNRRQNLRDATALQNMMNRAAKRGGTSEHKGVWFDRSARNTRQWRAAIRVDGRLRYLGRFPDQHEAGRAYEAAARQHFGEFHRPSAGATI